MTAFKVQLDELASMHAAIGRLSWQLEDAQLKADLTAQAAGSRRVEDRYGDFVHVWSDARERIITNLDGLGAAVGAALGAYQQVEDEIASAATPDGTAGAPPAHR